MLAIEIQDKKLVPCHRSIPALKPGEVLVRVRAAGINRADILQRKGLYPPPSGASDIPGLEVSGVIEDASDDVGDLEAGDEVCALTTGGGYAEYCVAAARCCLPVPAGLTFTEAASLPETYFTVWGSVFELAKLREGESLLVTGGSSGIGVTAIQLSRAFGNRVFALAGNPDKRAACERLGAERAIDYRNEDFVKILRELTGGSGVDVVLDMAGGGVLPREIATLAVDGRIAMIGFMDGPRAELDLAQFLFKRARLLAFTLRSRSEDFKAKIAMRLRERVWPLIEAGKIRPVVHSTLPLVEAELAQKEMESGRHIGKIVLEITSGA
jgi:NADPH2:quinone reductase